jgi:hypothetical protein
MLRPSILFVGPIVGALIGCAGRAPQPIAVVQPQDRYIDCTAIRAEILANNKTVQGLASEEGAKVAQNIAAGVAGLFIWPLWFGMDFQGTAGKEEVALQSRQEYLAALAVRRGCAGSAATVAAAVAPPAARVAPPVDAQAPTRAAAAAPLSSTAIPMTPCGEDRPCFQQTTTSAF